MKKHSTWLYLALGFGFAYLLLKKPLTRGMYSLWTGPHYYQAITAVITSGDPQQIARLKAEYDALSPELKDSFDTTVRHLGLRRPW